MFKRVSKVQRPCTTGGTGACHGTCSGSAACSTVVQSSPSPAPALNPKTLSPSSATDFKDLAKQRAFMRKTSLAPSSPKKMSLREKERERRPTTASGAPLTSRTCDAFSLLISPCTCKSVSPVRCAHTRLQRSLDGVCTSSEPLIHWRRRPRSCRPMLRQHSPYRQTEMAIRLNFVCEPLYEYEGPATAGV